MSMYVKPSKENDASNPMEDIADFTSGPTSNTVINAQGQTEEFNVDDVDSLTYEPIPEAAFSVPGSVGVFNLKKGEDLIPFKTQHAGEDSSMFTDNYISYLCSSTGMPIEVLKMQFGQNYSASRGDIIAFLGRSRDS